MQYILVNIIGIHSEGHTGGGGYSSNSYIVAPHRSGYPDTCPTDRISVHVETRAVQWTPPAQNILNSTAES